MKKLIIKICVYAAFAILIIVLIWLLVKMSKDNARLASNYESIMRDNAQQQELTVKELKKYYSEELEKLKEYGVKPSDINNLVQVHYNVIDTTIYRDTMVTIYDTVNRYNLSRFEVEANCTTVSGTVIGDTITIDKIASHDSIMVVLYQTKKCMVPKYRRYRALVYSSCKQDTLQVINNIKIQKLCN